jgi:hypothetical protein
VASPAHLLGRAPAIRNPVTHLLGVSGRWLLRGAARDAALLAWRANAAKIGHRGAVVSGYPPRGQPVRPFRLDVGERRLEKDGEIVATRRQGVRYARTARRRRGHAPAAGLDRSGLARRLSRDHCWIRYDALPSYRSKEGIELAAGILARFVDLDRIQVVNAWGSDNQSTARIPQVMLVPASTWLNGMLYASLTALPARGRAILWASPLNLVARFPGRFVAAGGWFMHLGRSDATRHCLVRRSFIRTAHGSCALLYVRKRAVIGYMKTSMHFSLFPHEQRGRRALALHSGTIATIALAAGVLMGCSGECPRGYLRQGKLCQRESSLTTDAGVDAAAQPGSSGSGDTTVVNAGTGGAAAAIPGAGANATAGVAAAAASKPPQVVAGSPSTAAVAGQAGSGAGSTAGSPAIKATGPCAPGAMTVTEICDGQDDDCDGRVDENLDDMPCESSAQGLCRTGKKSCIAGKWTECAGAVEPTPEICDSDALDENCDGMSNEHCACTPGKTQECGVAGGICKKGTQTCSADATWGAACNGAVSPQIEICDGNQDEDCDGLPDTQDPDCACINGKSEACVAGQGVCAPGTRSCNSGKWSDCKPVTGPQTEMCDGIDTDCDGLPDNNAVCPSGQVCSNGHCACGEGSRKDCTVTSANGPCAVGTQTCQGGQWSGCTSSAMPEIETCDGIDNNCDGMIDECPSYQACAMGKCLPTGSYLDSCDQCSLSGSTLTCQVCKDGLKNTHLASLSGPFCSDVTNCAGQLSCVDCLDQIEAQGTYDDTCTNCVYNNKSLACDCPDGNNALQHTETWDFPCPGGFWNDNGTLRCRV